MSTRVRMDWRTRQLRVHLKFRYTQYCVRRDDKAIDFVAPLLRSDCLVDQVKEVADQYFNLVVINGNIGNA